MKRLSIFLTFLLCMTMQLLAEDIIVLRSSKRITVNIIEVGTTEVKYKEINNPNGPTFVLDTDDIMTIIYASGTVQNFTQRPKQMSEWEYERMQEAQRRQRDSLRRDSIAQVEVIRRAHNDSVWTVIKAHNDSVHAATMARWKAYPWTNMILLNGSYALYPSYAFGITYARVKQFGFYVSAMTSTGFRFNGDVLVNENGESISNIGVMPFYTGKKESTRISCTVGGMARLRIPLYLYAGVGYGYRSVFYELEGGQWAEYNQTPGLGVAWEAGLLTNIKGFGLSLGVLGISSSRGQYYEGKLGLGYCF